MYSIRVHIFNGLQILILPSFSTLLLFFTQSELVTLCSDLEEIFVFIKTRISDNFYPLRWK